MKPELSIKWAQHRVDCTPDGRKVCQGKCCTDKAPMGQGRYYFEELSGLPEHIKLQLEKRDDGQFYAIKEPEAPCPFLNDCIEHPEWKPLQCKIYPFIPNNNGRLVFYRGVFNCPNYDKGDKIAFENLAKELIEVFGKEWYEYWLEKVKE